MALTELTALDNAYAALQPLGQAARRRALQWLSDALLPGHTLPAEPDTADSAAATAEPVTVEAVVEVTAPAPARRYKAAAPKRVAAPAPAAKARGGRRLKTAHAAAANGRPYRRMPDPDTIMKA